MILGLKFVSAAVQWGHCRSIQRDSPHWIHHGTAANWPTLKVYRKRIKGKSSHFPLNHDFQWEEKCQPAGLSFVVCFQEISNHLEPFDDPAVLIGISALFWGVALQSSFLGFRQIKIRNPFLNRRKSKVWSNHRTLKVLLEASWVFPKIGVPQNGWFVMENPIKMDDLGDTIIFGNTQLMPRYLKWCCSLRCTNPTETEKFHVVDMSTCLTKIGISL